MRATFRTRRVPAALLVLALLSTVASADTPFNRPELRDSTREGTMRFIAGVGHPAYLAASTRQESRASVGVRDEVLSGTLADTWRSEAGVSSIRKLDLAVSSRQSAASRHPVAGRAPPLPGLLS